VPSKPPNLHAACRAEVAQCSSVIDTPRFDGLELRLVTLRRRPAAGPCALRQPRSLRHAAHQARRHALRGRPAAGPRTLRQRRACEATTPEQRHATEWVRSRGHGSAPRCWRTPRATRPRRTSNEVAGQCPRLAESLLRDGRFSGRVSAAASAVLLQPFDVGQVPRVVRCATAASAVASQLPLQRCFCSLYAAGIGRPASFAARRPLQRSRLSCRFSGASAVLRSRRCWRTPRATRPRRTSNEVAGQCPRLAESLLRDGRFSGRVSAAASAVLLQPFDVGQVPRVVRCATAASAVASQLPLQRCFCSLSAAGIGCPASLLRDGHYNGRVSAAVTTVAPTISLAVELAQRTSTSGGPLPSLGGVVTARRP